jgi:hypothetical protein
MSAERNASGGFAVIVPNLKFENTLKKQNEKFD